MDRVRETLFQVVECTHDGDRVHVTGRNCSDELQVGDVFTAVSPWQSPDREPVALRIERILFYRNCMTQLDPGMTAELELSGTGRTHLIGHVELHGHMTAPLGTLASLGPGTSRMRNSQR